MVLPELKVSRIIVMQALPTGNDTSNDVLVPV
jgi:hypothetical protein